MTQLLASHPKSATALRPAALLLAAVASGIFSSPKWGFAPLAWVYPFFLLLYFRHGKVKGKLLWASGALILGHVIADMGVAPFPLLFVLVVSVYKTLLQLLLYGVDARISRRSGRFVTTLFFPALAVVMEYLNTVYAGGVWWSVANIQYPFAWLAQLASVTGIWGISFVLYWTASVAVWAVRALNGAGGMGTPIRERRPVLAGLVLYGVTMMMALGFGCWRYYATPVNDDGARVRVAGVTVPLVGLLETFCSDYNGQRVVVNPKGSLSDPVMRVVGQAEASFVATADTVRFRRAAATIRAVNDSLFLLSQQAVDHGARIVSWSEGNAIVWKSGEQALVARGQAFAARNGIYLLLTACVIHPGPMRPGDKFLENEAVLLGPDGSLLTRFHKNHPVPMAEASVPGDGIVPVVPTPYGRLGVSICYDADHPVQMRQLGQKSADLLLLPSGDWYAISAVHCHMAEFRAIENGCSIFRETSNGLSVAADSRGRAAGSRDFFLDGKRVWVADMPVGHRDTVYQRWGDWLAWACMLFVLGMLAMPAIGKRVRKLPAFSAKGRTVPQL